MEVYDKNKTVSLIKNRINLRFSLLLSTFLLLLVTSYSLSSVTISSKKHDSLLLNRAGLQRMLIRQYVSEINQSLIGLAASNMDITLKQKRFADLTAKRFEKTLEAFLNGGEIIVATGWVTHVDIDNEIELTKKSSGNVQMVSAIRVPIPINIPAIFASLFIFFISYCCV